MLITADWILPVSRPPIRDGAVLVEHGRITEVGTVEELAGLNPDSERKDLPGCIITPGLVNAHTHLSLTALGGLLPPAPFEQWLPRLVAAIKDWERDDHSASAALGAQRCLEAGVTVVGDIVQGPEAPSVAADAGLGGVFFWEVLGVTAPSLFARLEELEFPLPERGGSCGSRVKCGVSPHSPYTSGPDLLDAVHRASMEFGFPVAIHVAESSAEVQLMHDGTGPLADVAARTASTFEPPGCTPIAYLDRIEALDGITAIHAGHTAPADVPRLLATVRGVVACPRSNAFLNNPVAPVSRLLKAGVPVGLGTDSSASNVDLDLMEEVRTLHSRDVSIPAKKLLEMVTAMGAVALGLEDRFGILERGMQADLAAFRIPDSRDPESDFVRSAGAATVEAVLTGGRWRVLEGRTVDDGAAVEVAAQAARIRAEHALQSI